jgi:CheY-like chemotaxis protein
MLDNATATILVIDDEPVVLHVLRLILTRAGYNVLAACNGREALACCARARDCVDLVISDVMMPGLSGPDVLARLRERIPRLPGILASGFSAGQDLIAAGDRFLDKPFRASDVLDAVREVLTARTGIAAAAA